MYTYPNYIVLFGHYYYGGDLSGFLHRIYKAYPQQPVNFFFYQFGIVGAYFVPLLVDKKRSFLQIDLVLIEIGVYAFHVGVGP